MTINDKQTLLNHALPILSCVTSFHSIGNVDILSDSNAIRLDIDGRRFRINSTYFVEEVNKGVLSVNPLAEIIQSYLTMR